MFVHFTGDLVGELIGEHVDEILERDLSNILGLKYEESDDPLILDAVVEALG